MLGESGESFVLVQSQVEAYMLTLLPLALKNGAVDHRFTDRYKLLGSSSLHTHRKSRSPQRLVYTMALALLT
jgi:hypothetical protein